MKVAVVCLTITLGVACAVAEPLRCGITTNLAVYTDIHSPTGTSHYYATKLNLVVENGLIKDCKSEGVFDLYNGLTAAESDKRRAEGAAGVDARRVLLAERHKQLSRRAEENERKGVVIRILKDSSYSMDDKAVSKDALDALARSFKKDKKTVCRASSWRCGENGKCKVES